MAQVDLINETKSPHVRQPKTIETKTISKLKLEGENSKLSDSQFFGDLTKKNYEDIDKLQDVEDEEKSGGIMHGDSISESSTNKVQIRLVDIVKRFRLRLAARKLINSTRSRMLKNMTNLQYAYINDRAQNFQDTKSGNGRTAYFRVSNSLILYRSAQALIKIFGLIPIINPLSKMKSLWDLFIAIVLLDSFFAIPIMVSFGLDETSISQKYCIQVFLILNALDIFVQTNTGFYRHGVICNNRQMIWSKYCNEQARIDICSLIPLLLYLIIFQFSDKHLFQFYQFITLSILIKLNRITKIYNNIQQNYILQPNKRNILSLLELFLKILAIAHICACIWILAGRISEFVYSKSWIRYFKLEDQSWLRQYLSAFYFCIVTMSTVGYGDIVAQTPIEICFCIVMVLFACGVFGFSVNTISKILQDFFRDEKVVMEKMFVIKNYLQKKSINQNLQRDVTEYLEYIWRSNKLGNPDEEEKMIKILPDHLRNELLVESNKIILKDCPILQNNFSEELIRAIIPLIKERNYTPDEIIYAEGDDDHERSIFFIQEGFAQKFISLSEVISAQNRLSINAHNNKSRNLQVIKIHKKGEYFGEVEFFTGESSLISVQSQGFSTILTISRDEFISTAKKFPKDYEQFCLIRDKITLNQDYTKIFVQCSNCKSEKHKMKYCPYLHFIPNVPKIIALSKRSFYQERNSYTSGNVALRNKSRYTIGYAQQLQIMSLFQEINEYAIEEYQQKYLQYSISKCDSCTYFTEVGSSKWGGVQQQVNNKESCVSLVSLNFPNVQNQLHNQMVYSNCNYKRMPSQQQVINTPYTPDDQIQPKIKSCIKNVLRKYDSPESIAELSLLGDPPSIQKGNTFNEKKNIKLGDQDYPFCSQMSQGLGSQHQINVSHHVNAGQTDHDDLDKQRHPSLTSMNSTHIIQNSNLVLTDSLNKGHRNRSILQFYDQQHQSHLVAPPAAVAILEPQINQQNKRQHSNQLLFDVLFGQFESMKNYQFYNPHFNYEIIIQQLHMNSEQKKKLQQKLLEQSKQRLSLLNKRKKFKTQFSLQSQLIYKSLEKDLKGIHRTSFISKNLICGSNYQQQHSLCPSKASPLKAQKIGVINEILENIDQQSTHTHNNNKKGSKKESSLQHIELINHGDSGNSQEMLQLNQLLSNVPTNRNNETDQSNQMEFRRKNFNLLEENLDFPIKFVKTQKPILDEDISNNSPSLKVKSIQKSLISIKSQQKNYFTSQQQQHEDKQS